MADMADDYIRLGELVARLGGDLVGDRDIAIRRVATLKSSGPGDITFLSHPRYRALLQSTRASAVIVPRSERNATSAARIVCDDPYLYFAEVARLLTPAQSVVAGIHPGAFVDPDALIPPSAQVCAGSHIGRRARIGERAFVGPGCFIGEDASVGDDSRLHANVAIYRGCSIGRRAIVHAGAVIGADGFGLALKNGAWLKIPQTGSAVIGDDVEIGANTTIDRGALDDTVIEDGVKLDNQIQVGHNVRIGAHSAIAGCVGIAGSASIGRHCTIGGGAVILGHLEIADHVNVSAFTLITKSIAEPGTYTGAYPFSEHRRWGRAAAQLRHLDELEHRVRELEDRLRKISQEKKPRATRPTRRATRAGPSNKG